MFQRIFGWIAYHMKGCEMLVHLIGHMINCSKNSVYVKVKKQTFLANKKVLLHERKRHTACRIASAHNAALSNGGYPIQSWVGGTPSSLARGYPIQSWLGGYSIQFWLGGSPSSPDLGWGTPSSPGQGGTPSSPGQGCTQGNPLSRLGMEYSPSRPGMGYPLPQSRCGLTHKVKILPSPILQMRAVIKRIVSS